LIYSAATSAKRPAQGKKNSGVGGKKKGGRGKKRRAYSAPSFISALPNKDPGRDNNGKSGRGEEKGGGEIDLTTFLFFYTPA